MCLVREAHGRARVTHKKVNEHFLVPVFVCTGTYDVFRVMFVTQLSCFSLSVLCTPTEHKERTNKNK